MLSGGNSGENNNSYKWAGSLIKGGEKGPYHWAKLLRHLSESTDWGRRWYDKDTVLWRWEAYAVYQENIPQI